jgi:hypothetical protein
MTTTEDKHLIRIQICEERTAAACWISRSLVLEIKKREKGSCRRQPKSFLLFQHAQGMQKMTKAATDLDDLEDLSFMWKKTASNHKIII